MINESDRASEATK